MSIVIKHQVFVSSTYLDLQEERQAAVEAILNAGHIPAGMELFAADDRSQLDVIRSWIDESDIYMLILGSRYGSIEPSSGQSYTEVEYRYALEIGKPAFAVVLTPEAIDEKYKKLGSKASDHNDKLKAFKDFVMSKVVKPVSSLDQIKLATIQSIQNFSRRKEIGGWTRVEPDENRVETSKEIARLSQENRALRSAAQSATAPAGPTVEEWIKVLNGQSLRGPEGIPISLYNALVKYSPYFAEGVNNSAANASPSWLYSCASALAAFGLVEHGRVPSGVSWSRLQLSNEGKQLVRMLRLAEVDPDLLTKRTGSESPKAPRKKPSIQ